MSAYQPLTVETVPAWLDARPLLRALVPGDRLQVREVGDGNLNLVFIVRSDPARPGLVLKQSLPWVRVHGESWPLTLERARHEGTKRGNLRRNGRERALDAVVRRHSGRAPC